ncbi:hypothetical protein [Pantoea sp. OXWO6B1]|uniref:hypothetical protein n=1 Tax=Pantoea sp. OXWO6B1 TaxID=1835724 RepID=UPI0007C7C4E2|nr:hypothetical protein [Pantoea sp. OXWO6B1]OAD97938.1 hypothetical protein A6A26_23530 [Pantoea sp. OXWO6B1]
MKPLLKGAILALCLMQVPPVMSASFASRSSFRSSAGFAARSPAYRPSSSGSAPVYRSFRPETGSRTAGGASGSASGRVNSASSAFRPTPAAPRSLLSGSGTWPSARLQTIIREKEASGPGWVGTAALVWLLSRHDLSSGDRAWINERLREANNNAVSEPDAPVAEQSDVRFQWAVPALIVSGQPVKIVVTAVRHGKALVPACELGDMKSEQENNAAVLNWTPENTFSAVATCRAEGWVDQRLLAVSQTSGGKL